MKKQASTQTNKESGMKKPQSPFAKERTLVELYLSANGAQKEIASNAKVVHYGEIDKIPPKGWENYIPPIKKKPRKFQSQEKQGFFPKYWEDNTNSFKS